MADLVIYRIAQSTLQVCKIIQESIRPPQGSSRRERFDAKIIGDDVAVERFFRDTLGPLASPSTEQHPIVQDPLVRQMLGKPWTYEDTTVMLFHPSSLHKAPAGLSYECVFDTGESYLMAEKGFIWAREAKRCNNFKVVKSISTRMKAKAGYDYSLLLPSCDIGNFTMVMDRSWEALAMKVARGDVQVVVDQKIILEPMDSFLRRGDQANLFKGSAPTPAGARVDICGVNDQEEWSATIQKYFIFIIELNDDALVIP